jgi:hypothetical protein
MAAQPGGRRQSYGGVQSSPNQFSHEGVIGNGCQEEGCEEEGHEEEGCEEEEVSSSSGPGTS